jgi:glycosyltransferase involved in cell wall biosynthesis
MNVAIVHDWLTGMRGGEKCLEVFCELFPKATIFTLIHNKGSVSETIEKMDIRTSFIQRLPKASVKYRNYLPLFPMAIQKFNLHGYDFVLSSSHCVAKGVKVPKDALHICYCYTPMRYAWLFFHDYFGHLNVIKRKTVSFFIERLKKWDLKTNENVDFFIAISDNVRNRIKQYYHRDAQIIHPPVEIDRFNLSDKQEDFYLIVSALVPYKKIDIAIKAFNLLKKKLVIIGTGDHERYLKKISKSNIEFLGWTDDKTVADYYSKCRAFIFPGEEDFGITPLEAQACGKPVIAYSKGGALETLASETAVFFHKQTQHDLIEAIRHFEKIEDNFDRNRIRQNALRFDRSIFKKQIKDFIEEKLNA